MVWWSTRLRRKPVRRSTACQRPWKSAPSRPRRDHHTLGLQQLSADAISPVNSPTPSIGTGTATALGMTNSLSYAGGTPFTGSVNTDDLTVTTGGTDPERFGARLAHPRQRTGHANNKGNGWNTAAPQYTQGAQFMVSTAGYYNIVFQYDWYTTAQGVRDLQAQYTTDGSTWTNVGPLQVAPVGWRLLRSDHHQLPGAWHRFREQ